jgi:hypothetical protein
MVHEEDQTIPSKRTIEYAISQLVISSGEFNSLLVLQHFGKLAFNILCILESGFARAFWDSILVSVYYHSLIPSMQSNWGQMNIINSSEARNICASLQEGINNFCG